LINQSVALEYSNGMLKIDYENQPSSKSMLMLPKITMGLRGGGQRYLKYLVLSLKIVKHSDLALIAKTRLIAPQTDYAT
jgi:hypothetical protein